MSGRSPAGGLTPFLQSGVNQQSYTAGGDCRPCVQFIYHYVECHTSASDIEYGVSVLAFVIQLCSYQCVLPLSVNAISKRSASMLS